MSRWPDLVLTNSNPWPPGRNSSSSSPSGEKSIGADMTVSSADGAAAAWAAAEVSKAAPKAAASWSRSAITRKPRAQVVFMSGSVSLLIEDSIWRQYAKARLAGKWPVFQTLNGQEENLRPTPDRKNGG